MYKKRGIWINATQMLRRRWRGPAGTGSRGARPGVMRRRGTPQAACWLCR